MAKQTKIEKLIKELIQLDPTISIVRDNTPHAVISPAILSSGVVEYQVSDAIVNRGKSYDAYSWNKAKKYAIQMNEEMKSMIL